MDVSIYINELLKSHKQVGITNLGTFFKKKSPGRYDAETHEFLPPSYILDFTTEVLEEYTLLNYISKQRGISTGSSQYFINQFVESIEQNLAEQQEAEIENIGKLVQKNNVIEFEPAQAINFGFDFYGLPPVKDVQPKTTETELTSIEQKEPPFEINKPIEKALDINTIETVVPDELEIYNEINPLNPQPAEHIQEENLPAKTNEEEVHEEISEVITTSKEQTPEETIPNEDDEVFEEISEINEPSLKNIEVLVAAPLIEDSESASSSEIDNINSEISEKPEYFKSAPEIIEPHTSNNGNHNIQPECEEYKPKTSLFIKILIGILIVLAAGAIAYFIQPEFFNNLIQKNIKAEAPIQVQSQATQKNLKTETDSLALADSIVQNAKKAGLQVDSARDSLTATVQKLPLNTTTFEVIGASVLNQKEADDFIATMKTKGIPAKVVEKKPGNRIKISIASFNTDEAARKERLNLEKQLNIKGLYIYTNKPIKK